MQTYLICWAICFQRILYCLNTGICLHIHSSTLFIHHINCYTETALYFWSIEVRKNWCNHGLWIFGHHCKQRTSSPSACTWLGNCSLRKSIPTSFSYSLFCSFWYDITKQGWIAKICFKYGCGWIDNDSRISAGKFPKDFIVKGNLLQYIFTTL